MNDTASFFCNNIALGTLLLKQAHYNLLSYKKSVSTNYRHKKSCSVVLQLFIIDVLSNKFREEEETRTPTSQLTLPPQSSASTNSATSPSLKCNALLSLCPEQDSNLHVSQHSHLKRARLPFRHLGRLSELTNHSHLKEMSGKRDSNSRPRPWQGRALPTELLPHFCYSKLSNIVCNSRLRVQRYCFFLKRQAFLQLFFS